MLLKLIIISFLISYKQTFAYSQSNKTYLLKSIDKLFIQLQSDFNNQYIEGEGPRHYYNKNKNSKSGPKTIITQITFSSDMNDIVQEHFKSKIKSMPKDHSLFQLFLCDECMMPRVRLDESHEKLIIEKGPLSKIDYLKIFNLECELQLVITTAPKVCECVCVRRVIN